MHKLDYRCRGEACAVGECDATAEKRVPRAQKGGIV